MNTDEDLSIYVPTYCQKNLQSSQIAENLSLIRLEKLQSESFSGSQSMTGPIRVL